MFSNGREVQIPGLSGLQDREFFTMLLPLYEQFGVPGAADQLRAIHDDEPRRQALDQLSGHIPGRGPDVCPSRSSSDRRQVATATSLGARSGTIRRGEVEARSFLEQEPVAGIGVEHQSRPGDEAGEDVVIGDRVELVGGAVGDKSGHSNPWRSCGGRVGAVPPVGHGGRPSHFREGRRRGGRLGIFRDRCRERVVGAGR